MSKEKERKYNAILTILELLLGCIFVIISILIWPMTILLLVIGIVLLVAGIGEIFKFIMK